MQKGFTLIELLIVVAIIAILAAIAVPNFLEAQTRAKVARVMSDMRSIATGLETYHIDTNHYPPHGFHPPHTDPTGPFPNGSQILDYWITTPVSYLSSLSPTEDVFAKKYGTGTTADQKYINSHMQYACFMAPWSSPATRDFAVALYGDYRLTSAGPDGVYFGKYFGAPPGFAVITYDATNGTMSNGDIFRTALSANPFYYRP